MANEAGPQGLGGAKLSGIDKELEAALALLTKNGQLSASQMKSLDASLAKVTVRAKNQTTTYARLAEVMTRVGKGTETFKLGAVAAADELSKASDLSTKSSENYSKIQLGLLSRQINALQQMGTKSREVAVLDEQRSKIEVANYQARLKTSIQLAALQVRQGDVAKGTVNGLVGAMKLKGSQAGQIAGDFFGQSAKAMGVIAGAVGGFVVAFAALKFVLEQESQGALDAAKAGVALGDGLGEATAAGRKYLGAVMEAGRQNGLTVISNEKIMELAIQSQNEYGLGLARLDQTYTTAAKSGALAQGEAQVQVVSFVGDMAKLSGVMGLSQEEAVRLGTRLGVLGKSGFKEAGHSALLLSQESKRLGVPVNSLVSIFEVLATQADHAGSSTGRLTQETLAFTEAVLDMGKKDAMGKAARGMQNLDPEKAQRVANSLAQFMTHMDGNRLMALTMKPGENLSSSLNRLELGQTGMRVDALQNAMKMIGISKDSMAGPNGSYQAMTLAKYAGMSGDSQDLMTMGRYLAGAVSSGALSENSIKKQMAQVTDTKFDQAKSVGSNLAAGADIMQVIAGTLMNMLRVVIKIADSKIFGGDFSMEGFGLEKSSTTSAQAGHHYAGRTGLYRSASHASIG